MTRNVMLTVAFALALPVGSIVSSPGVAAASAPAGDTATSRTFAGYAAHGGRRTARVRLDVPTITCGASSASMLTGITSFDRDGRRIGAFGIRSTCIDGGAVYEPVTLSVEGDLDPIEDLPVDAGDVVRLVRKYNRFEVSEEQFIQNQTKGWAVVAMSLDATLIADRTQIGDSRADVDGRPAPPPAFDRHLMRRAAVGPTPLQLAEPTRLRMISQGGSTLIRPTPLDDRPRFTLVGHTGAELDGMIR